MANLNKVMLIGRLTRDPEAILDGKGAKFGFAVNNRKLNQATNQWEDVPVFIDCEIWNRGEQGQQASRLNQTVRKGQQIFLEGHLKMDTWTDKNDGKQRSKLVVVVENFQYLEAKGEGGGGNGGMSNAAPRQAPRQPAARQPAPAQAPQYGGGGGFDDDGGSGGGQDDIPF